MKPNIILPIFISILFLSCYKNKLDLKPNQSLVVPTTIQDFQAILDNNNAVFNVNHPFLGETGADDYYLLDANWNSLQVIPRNAYIWKADVFEGNAVSDWANGYKQVYNSNVVLEGIKSKLSASENTDDYKNVKGSALFFRANAYWALVQLFCKPYDSTSASVDLGLPLRLTSDVLALVPRSTITQTYNQIIADLIEAETLLPGTTPYKTRPSKNAAMAYLSRVYMSMRAYNKAFEFSKNSLAMNSTLLTYSTLSTGAATPFLRYNKEVLWSSTFALPAITANVYVDSTVYGSYSNDDLRKTLFFVNAGGRQNFKGSYYENTTLLFSGLANDELYLNLAECYARQGDRTNAMLYLNNLLRTRWRSNPDGTTTYVDMTAATPAEALSKILTERRKELIFRGLRWVDLRRLNKEGANITLTRKINNETYTLPPNDPRYVYDIPAEELQFNPIEKNNRQ